MLSPSLRAGVLAWLLALLLAVSALAPSPVLAQAPPATPASVEVTRADGTLTASWHAVKGATSYWITYSSDGGASWSLAALNHTEASITVSPVTNSATYIVGVRARNDHGDSGWRNSPAAGPFVPASPPATPASVAVARADGTLTASWDAVDDATSYWITYSSDGGASWSLAALNHTEASITVSPVTNSATYIVGVRARSDHGDSGWRNSPAAGPFVPIAAALTIGDAEAEEGDALSFPVTLDSAVPGGFTVTPNFTDGTATAGFDYTANTGALSFSGSAGETQTLTVSTSEDKDVEDDETFTVGLSVSGTAHDVTASDTATGTISNDDQAPTVSAALTIADADADEGNALAFTVRLDNAVPGGFTVTPTFTDGATVPGGDLSALTARQGSDYRASQVTLDFAGTAGETVTFTVPTIEDGTAEYPELFTVGLAVSGTTHSVTATDTATGIIRDDDTAASAGAGIASNSQLQDKGSSWWLWSPPAPGTVWMDYYCEIPKRVVETTNRAIRSKVFQIPCKLGGIATGAVVEMWSTGSATATNGGSNWDYKFYHSKFNMYPGDKGTQRHAFLINDDQVVEAAESFQFALKWTTKIGYPPFYFTVNESLHVLTVHIDDDDAYQLSVSPDSVSESGGAKTVTVTATNVGGAKLSEDRTIDVQVGAAADHAVEGTDYQTVNNFDLTIPKGSSSATGTFTLTPVADTHLEAGERITVSGSGDTSINGHKLQPRITDSGLWLTDSATITLSATPDVTEGGGAQTVTVTATASGTAQRAIPVTISVGKSGDGAVEGTDYNAVSDFTLTIPSGSSSGTATFKITPINDTTQESDETLSISGSASGGSKVTGTSVTILDNDVLLSLSPASVGEEGGAQTVDVTARVKTARTTSRALTVSVGKLGDQAVSGTDYGAVADFSLTIAANQTSGTATFTFTPTDDTIIEGSETLTVHATGTGLDVNSATLTLTETDTTDFVISLNPSRVAEGINWRDLGVTISTTEGYTVSKKVTCMLQNGGGSATYNTDYQMSSSTGNPLKPNGTTATLTIPAGNTSGSTTFRLRTMGDSTVEGDETVQIKGGTPHPHIYKSCLSGDNPRTVDSEPYPANLTIVDSQTSIHLSANPSSVAENAGATNVAVTVSMGGNHNAPADMPVTVTVGKSGDSATSGTDYEAVEPFLVTIPQGSKSGTTNITFTPKDDALVEGGEFLTLSGTTPKTSVGDTHLSITDDDSSAITLTAKPASVSEGDGSTTVTVTASTNGTTYLAPRYVTVQVGKTGDGATEGTDYTTVDNFDVTIPFGKTSGTGTFTLTPVDDTTLESDESISISGITTQNDTVTGTSVTIKDNDAQITLAASPSSVTEDGGAKTVTVTATSVTGAVPNNIQLTIAVGKSGDAAIEGTDYAVVADFTFEIGAYSTTGTGTFTLTPTDDNLYEGSEKLSIGGSATGYRVGKTEVTITDDDNNEKVTVALSVKPKRVKECSGDTTMTVTAELPDDVYSLPEARKITLSVGKSTDSATSGTDYTAVDDFTLNIPAGQHTGLATFTLTPTDDTAKEGDETITLHGTAKRLAVGNDAQVTIEDDDQPIIILTMNPAKIPETISTKTTTVTVTASLWDGEARCATDSDDEPDSAASMAATAEGMVGASASEIARAVLGLGARPASQKSDQTVAVVVGDSGDTAVSGTDYTAVSNFTITIKGGETSGKATFTTTAGLDNLLEPPESLTVKGAAVGTTVTPAKGQVDDKDKAAPSLTVSPTSVSEGASATTVTVTLNTGGVSASQAVQVPFKVSSGTAASGTDFAAVPDFNRLLKAGETSVSGTFTLTPTDDTVIEGDETIKVSVPGSKPALEATVTLTDDDQTDITLTVNPSSWSESGMYKEVWVTAATDGDTFLTDRTVTVTVGDTNDSATSGTDYMAVDDFDITIKAGTTSGTASFYLTPVHDTIVEGDETISVDGTSTGLTVNGTSITLTDNDSAAVTVDDVSEDEGDALTFTVTLGNAVQGGLTVTPGYTNGTAEAADYTTNTTALSFTGTANETKTFTVQTTEDAVVEADETFTVGLTVSNAPSGVTATDTGTGTIDNDDSATVTIAGASTAEGGSLSLTATLDKAVDGGLRATPGYTDVSATKGTDYTANTTALIFTGTANETKTFAVQTKQDTTVEDDETFTVAAAVSGLATGVTGVTGVAGTGTITDDDGTVTLSATPSSVAEDGGVKTVTVTATSAHSYAAAKTITVTVGKTGDSAESGKDYTAVADFTMTLPANSKSGTATFSLTPTNDNIIEDDETLSIDGASGSLTVNGTSVTITDDEGPDIGLDVDVEPFLDANPDRVAESDAAKQVKVTAGTEGGVFLQDREVYVTVGDSADSALEGTDYQDVAGFTVTIKANQSSGSKTFTLTPIDDTLVEGDESITVSGSASALTVTSATITVTDDDIPGMSLAANPSSVSEGAGDSTVTVTASTGGVTFKADRTVTVSVGKSGDSATSGTDYATVTDFDVTITKGDTSGTGTYTLTPTDDTLIEGDETISVYGTATGLTVTGTSIALKDNDVAPAVNLSVDPSSVSEGAADTTVTVTATFSNSSTYETDTTVTVAVGDGGDSATSGTDYAAVTSFDVTIAKGKSSGTADFTLAPTQDTLVEGNETITVGGTATGLTVNDTSITLTDDDGAPAINLSVKPSSVAEGDTATEVTVTATFSTASIYETDTTVTVSVGGSGTATSGTDYAAVTDFDITIKAKASSGAAEFTLTPTQDTLVEGNETIAVSGTNADLTVNGTDVTLTDDDSAALALAADPASVSEGAKATTITVTASTGGVTFKTDTTVNVTVGDKADGATSGTDYADVAGFDITITAGQTSGAGTFALAPIDDNLIEGDEAISVEGAAGAVGTAKTTVTLVDDDRASQPRETVPIVLAAAPSGVSEGAGATTVTVTATVAGGKAFPADVTVAVSVGASGDGAAEGTDYAAVADLNITIPAQASSATGTFTLTPIDDTLIEGNETISVDGTAPDLTVTGTYVTLTDDDAAPAIDLSVNPASVGEGAGGTSVTVTAAFSNTSTYANDTTVTLTVGDGSDIATSGTDYTPVNAFTVTIAAGQTSGSAPFTLTPVDDTLVEGNETITVGGAATGLTVNGTSMTLTDNDGAPAINLSVDPSSVAEDAGATTVTVTAAFSNASTYATDTTVTVAVGDGGDSATSGTDYTPVKAFTVTVAAGASSGSAPFMLTPVDDTLIEDDEAITISGSSTGLTVNGTSMTLTDDDGAPAINLSVDPSSVAEDAGATTVTVTAAFSNASTYDEAKTVTVSVGASGDSATEGTDYATVTAFDVTIAAGQTSGRAPFTLIPVDDTLVEGNETITISGNSAGLTVNGTSMTLTDDDGAPAINLSVNPSSVAEDAGATTVTVTAAFSGASTYGEAKTVTVSVGAGGDSATEGTDYAAVTAFDVTIAAGQTSGSAPFTLTPVDDTLVEGNETITVGGAATGLTVNGTSMTLTDNDGAPAINLSVDPSSVAEDAGATTVTVTAAFSNASTYATDTTVTVAVGDGGDSATSGTDYTPVKAFTVTVAAGASSGSAPFMLTPVDDTLIEGNETISAEGTAGKLTVNGTSMTLTDDDGAPAINLSVDPSSVAEDASATTVTVTAAFSNASTYDEAKTVTVSVGASGDSATEGTDYGAVTNFDVTIAAGQTSGSAPFTLTPTDDTLIEGNETISVDGTASGLAVNGTSLTLTDDDSVTATNLVINLSVNPASVAEDAGASTVTVTATFSNGSTYPTDIPVTVSVGAGADGATSGADYAAVSDFKIAIAAGQASGSAPFTLAPINDDLVEDDESISIAGTSPGLTVSGAGVALTDDEAVSQPEGQAESVRAVVSIESARAEEGKALTFTARLSDAVPGGFTVTPVYKDVTATRGSDYTANAAAVAFAGLEGETATFTVPTFEDEVVEGDETFSVRLAVSNAPAGVEVGAPATGTIVDDDTATVTLSSARAEEGETLTFTATLDRAVSGGLTATPSYKDGTATEGSDYTRNTASLAFEGTAGETVALTVPTVEDAAIEEDETFTVALVVTDALPGVAGSQALGTIANDDEALVEPPRASVRDAGADEGDIMVFTVALDRTAGSPVTVDYATEDGTARSGRDYTAVTGTLTFAPGTRERTVSVQTLDDALDEGDETLWLRLTRPVNAVLADPSGLGTISNDDHLPESWMTRCGRAAAGHVVDAVEARLDGQRSGTQLTIAGAEVMAAMTGGQDDDEGLEAESHSMTGREVLAGSAFMLASQAGSGSGGSRWVAWGSGATTRFEESGSEFSLEGDVAGGTVGVDVETGRLTVGVAVSHNECEGTWRDGKSGQSGTVESPLSSVHPYLEWSDGGLSLWGMVGLGQGPLTVSPDGDDRDYETDMEMSMAALGGRRALVSAEAAGGFDLAARWDALLVSMNSDAAEDLRAVDIRTSRARLALEAGRTFVLDDLGGTLEPSLEIGLRHDGGGEEHGLGLEVGGQIRYVDPALGLTVELSGRSLLAHGDDDYREWGARGTVQVDPGADGLGLSLRLQPSWGAPESGISGMWQSEAASMASEDEAPAHLDAEFGYSLRGWDRSTVITPLVGFGRSSADERLWRLGIRLDTGSAFGLDLALEGATQAGEPGHDLFLRGRLDAGNVFGLDLDVEGTAEIEGTTHEGAAGHGLLLRGTHAW